MKTAAQSLLLEFLAPSKDGRILILEGGGGHIAVEAAQRVPNGEVLSLGRDFREMSLAEQDDLWEEVKRAESSS